LSLLWLVAEAFFSQHEDSRCGGLAFLSFTFLFRVIELDQPSIAKRYVRPALYAKLKLQEAACWHSVNRDPAI
jgi:hypothetical protein